MVIAEDWRETSDGYRRYGHFLKLSINCYNDEDMESNLFGEDRSIRATISEDSEQFEFSRFSCPSLRGQQSAESELCGDERIHSEQ